MKNNREENREGMIWSQNEIKPVDLASFYGKQIIVRIISYGVKDSSA